MPTKPVVLVLPPADQWPVLAQLKALGCTVATWHDVRLANTSLRTADLVVGPQCRYVCCESELAAVVKARIDAQESPP